MADMESTYRSSAELQPAIWTHSPRIGNHDEFNPDINSLDMRNAENRLTTFEQFWDEENEFKNIRLLAHCGFYCIGQGDAVECFCCHTIIANWQRNDNPKKRHEETSPECRFVKDELCGHVSLPLERRQPVAPTQLQSRTHSSSTAQSLISHPSLQVPAHAASGTCSYSNPTVSIHERSNLLIQFPCLHGANEQMRSEEARLQTFTNLNFRHNTQMKASIETLAKAGFFYLGNGDSVKCWFCGGELRGFAPEDDPWLEHAKFYPHCEHLLHHRGPEWVTAISDNFPNITSPTLPRRDVPHEVEIQPHSYPQQREEQYKMVLAEGMQSGPVQTARAFGYSDDTIRAVQWDKILSSGCCYQTSEALINALIGPERDNVQGRKGNLSNLGNTRSRTNHIHGGNFVGPSNITGLSGVKHYGPTVTIRQPQSTAAVNGQPFNEYMQNAFGQPFFLGEMDHLLNGGAAAVTESSELPHRQVIDHFGNPMDVNPASAARFAYPVRPPTCSIHPQAPTPRPPTPPPLRADVMPRLPAAATRAAPSAGCVTSSVSHASADGRLERERCCEICSIEAANILFSLIAPEECCLSESWQPFSSTPTSMIFSTTNQE